MKKTILIIVLAALCLNFRASAQGSTQITGRVIDSADNKPLNGATVTIKGSTLMTSSIEDGSFTINTKDYRGVFIISFMGYKAIEKKFSQNKNGPFNISLAKIQTTLKEVSVISTGYQTLIKERATGSFSQPQKDMYNARVSNSVLERLQGITSGLVFNSGPEGLNPSKPDINIRGRSTIYSNDQPLIVVDNFPYNGDLSNINPQDVESIDILKDASAAAIWGVKAGNGVIVITTKKGKINQATKFDVVSNVTIGEKPNLYYDPKFMSSKDYIDVQQFLFRQGKYDADLLNVRTYPSIPAAVEIMAARRSGQITKQDSIDRINKLSNIDIRNGLLKYYYTNPIHQQYGFTASSGTNLSTSYFSAGYDKNQTIQQSVYNDRLTLNFSHTYKPIKNLEIATQVSYVLGNNHSGSPLTLSNATSVANTFFPYTEFADQNGNPVSVNRGYSNAYKAKTAQNNYLNYNYIPLSERGENESNTKTTDFRIFSGLKYSLFKGLSIEGKYQYQKYDNTLSNIQDGQLFTTRDLINRYSILTNGKVTGYNVPLGDILNLNNSGINTNNLRGQLNYHSTGKNSFNAILGAEITQTRNNSNSNKFYGYDPSTDNFTSVNYNTVYPLSPRGNGIIPNGDGISSGVDRFRSYFFAGSYTYNYKYTFSASARQDGSNYFGVATNQKTVPLWSVGGKWSIDKERFYDVPWLPLLQFRMTYGYNGNLNKTVTGVTTLYYDTNAPLTNLPYASISNIGNPELRWEKNSIINLGLDFSTKNDILSGSIEYFYRKGSDLIGNQVLAPSVGYVNPNTGTEVLSGNFAGLSGHGIDLQLTSKNLSGGLGWFTTVNLSYATDKVTKYDQLTTPSYAAFVGSGWDILPNVGKPVYSLYSYKSAGLNHNTGDPQGYVNGVVSKDYNALITPNSIGDIVYNGPSRPRYFGGITNRFTYKQVSLILNISYKFDYFFRRSTISYGSLFQSGGGNKDYNLRWQKPGDELITSVPSMTYPSDPNRDLFYQYSEATVEKGDHIRLQDVNFSYDFFNSQKAMRFPISKLQLFLYGNNLGILWRANKKGLDPDFATGGIPYTRTLSIGLKATL
jgi:TonB-linked SusC/RagA family outer membrane protein